LVAYKRSWHEKVRQDRTGFSQRKKKAAKKKESCGRGGLWKLPRAWKKSKPLRCFFPTVAWIKPSEKRARFYPQFPQARISIRYIWNYREQIGTGSSEYMGLMESMEIRERTRGLPHFPQARKQRSPRAEHARQSESAAIVDKNCYLFFRGNDPP